MNEQYNITIECGADFLLSFVVRNSSGQLVDLTGATVTAQLREYAEASDYFSFTSIHNGAGGRITLSMPHEGTAAIGYSSGVYDVFVEASGDREKVLWGDVTIIPEVTKPVDGTVMTLLSFASEDNLPLTGLVDRLYFSHASNKIYRWNGTNYVSIVTDGEAATVEVGTVTTLPAGSDATVENVGSLTNAKFNFGIPEGNGIFQVEYVSTADRVKTYQIVFTDPSAAPFQYEVTDGEKGNVMFATFDLDPDTGILSMTWDDEYTGPDFALNESGHLEVLIHE